MPTHSGPTAISMALRFMPPAYELDYVLDPIKGEIIRDSDAIRKIFETDETTHIWEFNVAHYYREPPTLPDLMASLHRDIPNFKEATIVEDEKCAAVTMVFEPKTSQLKKIVAVYNKF